MATKKSPPKSKAKAAPAAGPKDPFGARDTFETGSGAAAYYRLDKIEGKGTTPLAKLPYSIRVLLEAVLRTCDGFEVTEADVLKLASWKPKDASREEIPFKPARVVLQDFTGVPVVVDLAAMRDAVKRLGGDPARINPRIPVDLVIDHSVQIDAFGSPQALDLNADLEFQRNKERYEFLRWGATAFERFRVVPPATGIVHQVNLEYLANVVQLVDGVALPDSVVGTDSHTTMINGIGVLGWGVGGIEAEAAMLGQAMTMVIPDVVGFKLSGELPEGATATDLVLTVTEMLRKKGVVEKFVEFFGPGIEKLSLADRATVANMAPEYGATIGFFPVDHETLSYMRATGRPKELVELTERYCKANHLFRTAGAPEPEFTDVLELDLAKVVPSLAGPRRPQDRVALKDVKAGFRKELATNYKKDPAAGMPRVTVKTRGTESPMSHGSVVIAAITSCTNTSNPSVMVGAGLVAKKAMEKGLKPKAHVKTSLAPGSRVVTRYLEKAGLIPALESLGFHVVGYGCTTCIGNSGPIPDEVGKAIKDGDLVAAAVLSGNRNFEGRVHPLTRANYLASPPLVVAYALAGTVDIDFEKEPLGESKDGEPVFLRDLWPTLKEVQKAMTAALDPKLYQAEYKDVFKGSEAWNKIKIPTGKLYTWSKTSTYVQEPPYFDGLTAQVPALAPIRGARVLASFGDSVTTDHISPAGDIPEAGPAGAYLKANGVTKADFNSFGARRGNHQVMMRGTFANIRIKNKLVPGVEGGVTAYLGKSAEAGPTMSIYDAAMKYQADGVPLIVLAGKEYGTGSSRDWAAKGTILLGVRAVIAESFERIHRSNLIGMGVLPLQFKAGESAEKLGLKGTESYEILGVDEAIKPRSTLKVRAKGSAGEKTFEVLCRIDTPVEVKYLKNRGILHAVLRDMIGKA